MKKLRLGLLRSKSHDAGRSSAAPPADSPEANAAQGIRQFCESARSDQGEEVLHLPVIVEAAESSPQAAAAAAYQIRKFLAKDRASKVQYNAIMVMRILSDNPGPSFTRNMDAKFVHAVKDLLKTGKDPSVQQILRETLDALEAERSHDNGLYDLLSMWRTFKGAHGRIGPPLGTQAAPPIMYQQTPLQHQHQHQQQYNTRALPPASELASRIEEARNTAKILLQLVQSTPPGLELLENELIKEFAERSQGAQRNMQELINCNNPAPDDDTMQTLIETNEQLSLAQSRHQRAVLSARRSLGATRATPSPSASRGSTPAPPQNLAVAPPPVPMSNHPLQQQGYVPQQQVYPAQQQVYPPQQQVYPPLQQQQQQQAPSPVSPISETFTAPAGPPPSHLTSAPAVTITPHDPFADPKDPDDTATIDHDLDYTSLPQQHQHSSNEPRNYYGGGGGGGEDSAGQGLRPGYGDVTQSYLGRQYSAANGITMHGGVGDEDEEDGGGGGGVSPVVDDEQKRAKAGKGVRYRY